MSSTTAGGRTEPLNPFALAGILLIGTLFALAAGLMWGLVFVAPLMLPDYPALEALPALRAALSKPGGRAGPYLKLVSRAPARASQNGEAPAAAAIVFVP